MTATEDDCANSGPGEQPSNNGNLKVIRTESGFEEAIASESNGSSQVKSGANRLSYSDKTILAPMVRVGTLPMRLLALQFGADIVYTEELIDWKLLRSFRRVNDVLGTIDFVDETDGTIVFRTCSREREQVVLQMGTSDPQRALKAAKLVENDVAGIDINMGCPKEFSVKGGMGVALMADIEKAKNVLETLVSGLRCPVTCKVRVLPDVDRTVAVCQTLAMTGISAIGVHGRTRDERPQHSNRNHYIKAVANALSIPVIANGGSKEIESFEDIKKFKNETGCSSVMIARAAEWNVSIFRKEGRLPLDDVIKKYLVLSVDYDNNGSNTKYCVQNMLRELQETPRGKLFLEAQTLEQICAIWGLGDYCRARQLEFKAAGLLGRREICPQVLRQESNDSESPAKKLKLEGNCTSNIVTMKVAYLRSLFPSDNDLPKSRLLAWSRKQKLGMPSYKTIQEGKLFQSVLTLDGKQYTSSMWEKNKRWAEQGAALVCLCSVGQVDLSTLKADGSVL
ncbi:tRNA-dihydrouridine(20) synthase [NAD(P)+]-like [Frankliniella fusca]|uniref:tRNA-dihydrouridine(20) synthase [NAD(P)+]-like n=1 Tax=Frankliniella fusca TaxID=407009 RepID=A0AAE1I247_9NEOP|nr:tRNA-dihydrouridine(20) synthase [NAD(P)+]-like [Frankliniella fusca]